MSLKQCRYPGCKEMIHADNQLGACKPHRYWAKKNPADGGSTSKGRKSSDGKPKALPPRNSVASNSENSSQAVATICVTEAHLNNFWSRLSLEEKAEIFTNQLRS